MAAYALHLGDEGLLLGGLSRWSMAQGFHLSKANWIAANAIAGLLLGIVVLGISRRRWPDWLLVSISAHLVLHGLIHSAASIWWSSLSPGAITGVFVALPLSVWCLLWARSALTRRDLVVGLIVGALSFQAPWDVAVRRALGLPLWIDETRWDQ